MTTQSTPATSVAPAPSGISRRHLLGGAAALTLALTAGGVRVVRAAEASSSDASQQPNAWLTIHASGNIDIVFPSTEMGQGSSTALPLMLAEELDADWDRVNIQQLNSDDRTFGNPIFGNFLYTAGSSGVYGYMKPMRRAGAQARRMLLLTAANIWNVDPATLTTEPSKVVTRDGSRSIDYGALATHPDFVTSAPEITDADLKAPERFRLIGTSVPRRDVPSKTNGTATYAIDVRVPGMVYASVLRAPVEGEEPTEVDETSARGTDGVIDVVRLPDGLAVVAETPWAARTGRDRLTVTWSSTSELRNADSEADLATYRAAAEASDEGTVWFTKGAPRSEIENATTKREATYASDYAYHAQLEPMAAVASVSDDGKSAEVWAGTQTQSWTTATVANVLGTTPDRIKLNMMTMGGSFGRRTALMQEYVRDALLASRAVKRPVKVIWTREDDLQFGWFRPLAAQRMSGGLDASGRIAGWHHRVATPSVIAYFNPRRWEMVKPKDIISMRGAENKFYDFDHILAEHVITERRARIIPWRAIGASYTAFAAEAFMDELAEAAGQDPLAFRLSHTQRNPSGQRLLRRVAEMSEWSRKRDQTGLGLAYAGYGDAQAAGVAEVTLDRESGDIRVVNFWAAVDSGMIVAPDNAINQIEGSIVYGLSSALKESVTVKDGQVQEQNFGDYLLARMGDTPNIAVDLMRDGTEPKQVGEVGTPMVAPAIANAVFALTGRRLRHMPFTPERVLASLG
ncbi:MAG: molybdopterin cofactor-binding domain-containing protein [Pseudomonadota bacterium]